MANSEIIVLGAGPSGIALAHTLKHKLGCNDSTVYEKLDGPGGTWRSNTYPGVGCDVPTILYSFSFNLNPNWSKELCEGPEILEYMQDTVDKFDLRKHMHFGIECVSATWDNDSSKWNIIFHDVQTDIEYTRSADVLVSAVGGISYPRDIKFPGMEKFQGDMFHTARWNHKVDYKGKRMAVIGNGCSAAQVVPALVKDAAFVKQYARSAQWYHERPNRHFTPLEKFCLKYVPLWERYLRLRLFLANDELVTTYMPGSAAAKTRALVENHARQYIYSQAPKKYHKDLVPDFPLGCKRRIFDPNYLESLHNTNLEVVAQGIKAFDETGIISDDGIKTEFDIVVLATGFAVQQFLTPMEVFGKTGKSLSQQWRESRGAQAYMGSYVHNFPNFGILFGPNTFPAHNSVLFSTETQIEYIARTLIAPILDQRASIVEVKGTAEDQWVNGIHGQLRGSVFQAGCSNWYINAYGRNSASWPGYASAFWKETLIPRRGIFIRVNKSNTWLLRMVARWARTTSWETYGLLGGVLLLTLWKRAPAMRDLSERGVKAAGTWWMSLISNFISTR